MTRLMDRSGYSVRAGQPPAAAKDGRGGASFARHRPVEAAATERRGAESCSSELLRDYPGNCSPRVSMHSGKRNRPRINATVVVATGTPTLP